VTALSQDTKRPQLGGPQAPVPPKLSFPLETNTQVFAGGLAAINAAGNMIRPQTGGALYCPGVVYAGVNNLNTNTPYGAAGAKHGEVVVGCFPFATDGSITSGQLYVNCYAVDDNTVSASSNGGTRPYCGFTVQNPLLGGVTPLSSVYVMVGVANPYQLPETDTVPPKDRVRCVITALPHSYTGSGTGVLTGGSNAAIAAQNGVTLVAGDVAWLAKGATNITASKDAGPYIVTQQGDGATVPFILTRPFWWMTGSTLIAGCAVKVSGEDTLFGGSEFRTFCAESAVVDSNDPLGYPDKVTVVKTVTSGTVNVTGIPIRSATLSNVCVNYSSGTPDVGTIGYGPGSITAGEVSTGGSATAATVAARALSAINTANVSDSASVVHVTIIN
jgi:hypothetical protein